MMRFISFLHYFFYIAWHWDPLLALFTIYHEVRGEKKYHIHTIGEDELSSLKEKGIDISHAHIYMPVNYYVLERLMNEVIKYDQTGGFLDLGCGKGRVLIVAAEYGFQEITGVDISGEFCSEAASITGNYGLKNPRVRFTVLNEDALRYEIPPGISTIFLFNPFDELVMNAVVSNMLKSQQAFPRILRVLYANPQHKSLFLETGFSEIFYTKKMDYFEGMILEKRMEAPTPPLLPG